VPLHPLPASHHTSTLGWRMPRCTLSVLSMISGIRDVIYLMESSHFNVQYIHCCSIDGVLDQSDS
jgi:hypothetical protein